MTNDSARRTLLKARARRLESLQWEAERIEQLREALAKHEDEVAEMRQELTAFDEQLAEWGIEIK